MRNSDKTMDYEVVLSDRAQAQFRQIVAYLAEKLQSKQAARNVTRDMQDTIKRLSHLAGSLKRCEDAELYARGYRMIHLKQHRYFMLYKIVGHQARVSGIYHDLQDRESFLK